MNEKAKCQQKAEEPSHAHYAEAKIEIHEPTSIYGLDMLHKSKTRYVQILRQITDVYLRYTSLRY